MIRTLNEIIKSRHLIPIKGHKLCFTEENENAKCKIITFDTSDLEVCAFKVVKCEDIHPLLNSGGYRCPEGLIFCRRKNERETLYVVVIEMKSDNFSTKHVGKQIKSGKATGQYLLNKLEIKMERDFKDPVWRAIVATTDENKKQIKDSKVKYLTTSNIKTPFIYKKCNNTVPYLLEAYLL